MFNWHLVWLYLLYMTTQTVNRGLWQGIGSADTENSRGYLHIIRDGRFSTREESADYCVLRGSIFFLL